MYRYREGAMRPESERVQLGVGLGEISHLPYHALCLLSTHGETGRLSVQTAGAEAHQLQAHRSQELAAVVQLFLRFLFFARDVREGTSLSAQHRETTYAPLAGAVVEWVRLRFERRYLFLDAFGCLTSGAPIHVRER